FFHEFFRGTSAKCLILLHFFVKIRVPGTKLNNSFGIHSSRSPIFGTDGVVRPLRLSGHEFINGSGYVLHALLAVTTHHFSKFSSTGRWIMHSSLRTTDDPWTKNYSDDARRFNTALTSVAIF